MKPLEKEKAFNLRRVHKQSYAQISETLNVSKGTVSAWFKGLAWSKEIEGDLRKQAEIKNTLTLRKYHQKRGLELDDLYKNAEQVAKKEFYLLSSSPLFIAGLALYWGEGDKLFQNGQVRVSNIDAELLQVYCLFLNECCGVSYSTMKVSLLYYPDHQVEQLLGYWQEVLPIPATSYFKPTLIQGRHKSRRTQYGVCIVQVSNKELKMKILTWLSLFATMLKSPKADIV
jgi:hypothetical protein